MDTDQEIINTLRGNNPLSPPTPPFTLRSIDAPAVRDLREDLERKRIELDIKKQEIEIERLGKPNSQMDYWDKLIIMQQQHFNQMIEMEKRHAEMKIEIEKLKLSQNSSGEMDWIIDIIAPMLPSLLGNKSNVEKTIASTQSPENKLKGEDEPKMKPDEYLDKMRKGEITCEMAFEDFKLEYPLVAAKMTLENFKPIYEKIKIDGLPQQVIDRMNEKNMQ